MPKKLQNEEQKAQTLAEPYTVLAEFYDQFMDHVDYESWADYLLVMCHRNGHSPLKVLDAACGTGSFIREFRKRGITVFGTDASLPMIRSARWKLTNDPAGGSDTIVQSDILSLPAKRKFDTVICMYDSMNYLSSLNRIRQAVHSVTSVLAPGGVFIFDMSTEYNSTRHFNDDTLVHDFARYQCTRSSLYHKTSRVQETCLHITEKNTGKTWQERHLQYMYPVAEVREMLEKYFDGTVSTYKDYTFSPPDNACERVHFFLQKK